MASLTTSRSITISIVCLIFFFRLILSEIDFSSVNNLIGVFFDYDEIDKIWKMNNLNPYLNFKE